MLTVENHRNFAAEPLASGSLYHIPTNIEQAVANPYFAEGTLLHPFAHNFALGNPGIPWGNPYNL